MPHGEPHPAIEPVGSPRRVCIDSGGTWNAETQTCERRQEEPPEPTPQQKPIDTVTRQQRDDFGNIIGQTTEPLRPITKEERLEVGLSGLGGEVGAKEALVARQAEGLTEAELEAQKLLEPVRRELDPIIATGVTGREDEILGGELFPIVGPLGNILARPIRKLLGKDAVNRDLLSPETLRTMALTEIERIEIEKGLTRSERVGEFVEALNAGELAKFIPGISGAEKPSGNVQTLVTGLRLLKTRSRDVISNAETGDLTRSEANERLDVIEGEVQFSESRIKLLIQNSPELKFNSDGVNFIEGKILETRILIQDGRIAAIRGPVSESEMTASKIVAKINSFDVEDFDIPGQ